MTQGRILLENQIFNVVQVEIEQLVGKTPALILQQIHYWTSSEKIGKTCDGKRFVYNTIEDIAKALNRSTSTIKRGLKILKNLGVITIKKLSPKMYDQTNYYAINHEKIEELKLNKTKSTASLDKIILTTSTGQNEPLLTDISTDIYKSIKSNQSMIQETFFEKIEGDLSGPSSDFHLADFPQENRQSPSLPSPVELPSPDSQARGKKFKAKAKTRKFVKGLQKPSEAEAVWSPMPESSGMTEKNSVEDSVKDESSPDLPLSKPKNTTVQEMIKIWNEEVGQKIDNLSSLTQERARNMFAAFKFKFESSIENWRRYCKSIASSEFLMGKIGIEKIKGYFKLDFDWALKFHVIQKIFEKAYGCSSMESFAPDQKHASENSSENQKTMLEEKINASAESDEIKKLRSHILCKLGSDVYTAWYDKKHLEIRRHIDDDRFVTIELETNFLVCFLEPRHGSAFESFFKGKRLSFESLERKLKFDSLKRELSKKAA